MAKPTIKVYDAETAQEIEREMTAKEFADYENLLSIANENKQTELDKIEARKSALNKLAALGLTEAEIQALAG